MIIQQLARLEQLIRGKLFPFLILCGITGSVFAQNQSGGLVIPVVFHIVSEDPDTVTDLQIINALADLNDAFAGGGVYASGPGSVNTGIQFCLARTAPDGGNTSGITRTHSVLGDFDSDIENDRLKNLVSWDTRTYCNIWYVGAIKNEYLTQFGCGSWSRRHDRGYGSFDANGDYRDGVVTKALGSTLASLVGEYLGLKYTFVQGSCTNNNCDIDGDGICDTPPASAPGSSCSAYQNSCNTDSLSGFTQDMPDLVSNFMSLSGPCTRSFTAGQATKMRTNLSTVRKSLLTSNSCNSPCPENIVARFTRDNWSPKTGDFIHFTSLSSGGTNFQWMVDGVPVGNNSPVYSMSFPSAGKFHISLKVYNSSPGCFASYADDVIVNCGVMSRFTPNVREIASKDLISLDSILFTNRSTGAISYQWWMSNDQGLNPQTVSSALNLNYVFKTPGAYAVWLVASNGSCTDTTEKFKFTVDDPTVDGTVSITQAVCDHQTFVSATLNICNAGFASIPAGTPVSFYDADPGNAQAHKLPAVFFTTTPIAGKCCASFTTLIDAGRPGLNQLYAVFNDNGNSVPISLPNTKLPELIYINNINTLSGFQFRATVQPDSVTLLPGDSVLLTATAGPGNVTSYVWANGEDISCTNCDTTIFIASNKVYSISKKNDGCQCQWLYRQCIHSIAYPTG